MHKLATLELLRSKKTIPATILCQRGYRAASLRTGQSDANITKGYKQKELNVCNKIDFQSAVCSDRNSN